MHQLTGEAEEWTIAAYALRVGLFSTQVGKYELLLCLAPVFLLFRKHKQRG